MHQNYFQKKNLYLIKGQINLTIIFIVIVIVIHFIAIFVVTDSLYCFYHYQLKLIINYLNITLVKGKSTFSSQTLIGITEK